MIRIVQFLIAGAALQSIGCALDADGAGEVAQTTGGGGMTHRLDAEADSPSSGLEDAAQGRSPIVVVTPGGASEKSDASAPDAAVPDAAPPTPPKPGDDNEEGGKKN